MKIQELITETRRWAQSADDAGEVDMAIKAYTAANYLEQARDLYYAGDES